MYPITGHAQKQMARRAISEEMVSATLEWGEEYVQVGGCYAYFMSRRSMQRGRRTTPLPECPGLTVVVGPAYDGSGLVILTCHWEHPGHGKWSRRKIHC